MTTQCLRCGKCCKKGGPSLHEEDRVLVDSGRIPARHRFTIRKGELARDNVRGTLVPLGEEIIKIKGVSGGWTCVFYDEKSKGCGIYEDRPLECKALNCQDTREIEKVYDKSRLTRKDLLGGIDGLWHLVLDHERRCSYSGIRQLVEQGVEDCVLRQEEAILEIIRYDAHVRQLTMEKGQIDKQMLDFIFGRSLSETVKMFGTSLKKVDGRYRLVIQASKSVS